jgi:hypothetical protein
VPHRPRRPHARPEPRPASPSAWRQRRTNRPSADRRARGLHALFDAGDPLISTHANYEYWQVDEQRGRCGATGLTGAMGDTGRRGESGEARAAPVGRRQWKGDSAGAVERWVHGKDVLRARAKPAGHDCATGKMGAKGDPFCFFVCRCLMPQSIRWCCVAVPHYIVPTAGASSSQPPTTTTTTPPQTTDALLHLRNDCCHYYTKNMIYVYALFYKNVDAIYAGRFGIEGE